MFIDWTNTEVTGISGIKIEIPSEAKISIFTDNCKGMGLGVMLGSPSVVVSENY